MPEFKELPTPTYNYETATLRSYYEKAMSSVSSELSRLGLSNFERAQILATQAEIKKILTELDGLAAEWAAVNIEKSATDGVVRSLVALGLAETVQEAENIVRFSKLNRDLIKTAVADTQDDLLQISQNVDRKVRIAIRQAAAETMRSNMAHGINGTASLKRDLLSRLDEATKVGIIDARGYRWQPEVYAEMVVRTKMSRTHTEATINDALGRDVLYGVISSHGATDACAKWEGRIVKLVREAPGDYPYYGDLPRREIFQPNCKHLISPVRRPDRLPDNLKALNNVPEDDYNSVNDINTKAGEKPMRTLTDEKEIVTRGGKVAKGDKVLTDIYDGLDDDSIEEMVAREAGAHFKGKYRGASRALADLRYEWVDDNLNPGALATENYFSKLYDLNYKQKTHKKLTDREQAVIKYNHEQTINRFKDAGYTHVKVYRGVTWGTENNWLPEDTSSMTMKQRALTSWTTRKEVAREYADYVDDAEFNGSTDTHAGIIEAVIPIDQVGFTAIIGDTDEIVVIGDIKDAKLISQKRAGRKWR